MLRRISGISGHRRLYRLFSSTSTAVYDQIDHILPPKHILEQLHEQRVLEMKPSEMESVARLLLQQPSATCSYERWCNDERHDTARLVITKQSTMPAMEAAHILWQSWLTFAQTDETIQTMQEALMPSFAVRDLIALGNLIFQSSSGISAILA